MPSEIKPITGLPSAATLLGTDLLVGVTDPGGSPVTKRFPIARVTSGAFNVFNFGAVGNGLTDDTAAIQAAVTACAAAGGGTVVFPAGGTYAINPATVLTYYDNPRVGIQVKGSNILFSMWGATIVSKAPPVAEWVHLFLVSPQITISTDASSDWGRDGGHANSSNVWFEGGTWNMQDQAVSCIRFEEHTNGGVRNAMFHGIAGGATQYKSYVISHHHQRNIQVHDCTFYGGAETTLTGQHLAGVTALTVVSTEGMFAGQTLSIGAGGTLETKVIADVNSYDRLTLTLGLANTQADSAVLASDHPYIGVYFDGARGSGVTGCHFIGAFGSGIAILVLSNLDWRTPADGISVSACYFKGHNNYAIALHGHNHTIIGNRFVGPVLGNAVLINEGGTRYYADATFVIENLEGSVIANNVCQECGLLFLIPPDFDANQAYLRNILVAHNILYAESVSFQFIRMNPPGAGTNPITDIMVIGNIVHSLTKAHSLVRVEDGGISGCYITGNRLRLGGNFLDLAGGLSLATFLANNTVRNNDVYHSHGYLTPDPTVTASPYTYTNLDNNGEDVYVIGGTVSAVSKQSVSLPFTGAIHLEPGEAIEVTYTGAPTLKRFAL